MEVFFHNVPEQSTDRTFKNYLTPVLNQLSIQSFRCQKFQGKKFARVTFLNVHDGAKFLAIHGQREDLASKPGIIRSSTLHLFNRPIYAKKSKNPANVMLLRVMEQEEKARNLRVSKEAGKPQEKFSFPIDFQSTSVACGTWKYKTSRWVFVSQTQWKGQGVAKFGKRSLILTIGDKYRIDFIYSSIRSITFQKGPDPAYTITLVEAPRFFEKVKPTLNELMAVLNLNNRFSSKRNRLASLGAEHAGVAGSCFVYRIFLQEAVTISRGLHQGFLSRVNAVRKARETPEVIDEHTTMYEPQPHYLEAHAIGMQRLDSLISDGGLAFQIAFQVQKMAQNGILTPLQVISLLPEIFNMSLRAPVAICVGAIKKMFNQIPFAEPGTDPEELDEESLRSLLKENEVQLLKGNIFGGPSEDQNAVLVHRVRVTPAGVYLSGPEPEGNNRILRRYSTHHEYFLRVQFSDEDGEPVRFNGKVSQKEIFHTKFKGVLQDGVRIAGRRFFFLGFSHSSLRAQACWFMASFESTDGIQINARRVIEELGNFSHIRSPAKCAARIGQAFSDTPQAVHCPRTALFAMADVERNGRVFSDGVGTMSFSVMARICDALPHSILSKPTCIQIRYQGAKGMISYDSRLEGDALHIRPSMVKFDGSSSDDIEICGSARKPLPMKLNRQFIKILEDLGVDESFFLDLQAKEVRRLRSITASTYNASLFLERQTIGNAIQIPWLLKELTTLEFDFREDPFLRDVLEMAVLMELRKLKHKAQIPVNQGYHLYGIMDETGILEEGEVFCSVTEDGVPRIITGKDVIITRAPALHPGDIQKVNAVRVPDDSPLMNLTNCICFSQKGARDLPSQLSGGDLDGDMYYIMWDPRARFPKTSIPADYPRQEPIDIGKPIETHHMTDFFIQFMETDQLGRIATLHQVLADYKSEGTKDKDCITLAEMHSTAVDFSKTGIPVDMTKLPKNHPYRPDFMAPGPHVTIEKNIGLLIGDEHFSFDDDNNEGGDDEEDVMEYRYYESPRVLGKLFRAIDEREIFNQIQKERIPPKQNGSDFLTVVWMYVQRQCHLIQWEHLLEWARDIREMYEESLLDLMTEFSDHPLRPITELEAVVGNILGKNSLPSRRQHDLSTTMKEQYERNAAFIVDCITKEGSEYSDEALERSMAALAVSLEKKSERGQKLESFKYLAAAVCLRQVDRFVQGQRAKYPGL